MSNWNNISISSNLLTFYYVYVSSGYMTIRIRTIQTPTTQIWTIQIPTTQILKSKQILIYF